MKKILLFAALAVAAQLSPGCKHDADVQPSPSRYDVLAGAVGHWEWERSVYGFAGPRTPASVGFTRQLVFGANMQLVEQRNARAYRQTSYLLSIGIAGPCANQNALAVVFTNDTDLPNSNNKAFSISQQNGQRLLSLDGAAACIDGDATETYHWVAE